MSKVPERVPCYACEGSGKVVATSTMEYSEDKGDWIPSSPIPYPKFVPEKQVSSRCRKCGGKGWIGRSDSPSQCPKCKGEGSLVKTKKLWRWQYHIRRCNTCEGTGYLVRMVNEEPK